MFLATHQNVQNIKCSPCLISINQSLISYSNPMVCQLYSTRLKTINRVFNDSKHIRFTCYKPLHNKFISYLIMCLTLHIITMFQFHIQSIWQSHISHACHISMLFSLTSTRHVSKDVQQLSIIPYESKEIVVVFFVFSSTLFALQMC